MRNALALVLVLVATAASADLPQGEWRVARPIILPAPRASGPVYLPLDEEALAGARHVLDYRIARGGRVETPYRMVLEQGETQVEEIPASITSRATLGDEKTQIILDYGSQPKRGTAADFILPIADFRVRVEIEASSDQQEWWGLSRDAILFHDRGAQQSRVALPPHQFRYLRFTLVRLEGKLPEIEGIRLLKEVAMPRRLVEVAAKLSRREDTRNRTTVVELDLGKVGWDLAEARFEVEEASFDRAAIVEIGALAQGEEGGWEYRWATTHRLRRLSAGKQVTLPLDIAQAARLRISIHNGDDAPLTITRITLWRVRRGLLFAADPSHQYELWYGNPKAAEPDYDIARLPLDTPASKLPQASLGEPRKMALKPPPPPPWSDQHPIIFWAVLAAILVLLAIVIVRAMRAVKPAAPSP